MSKKQAKKKPSFDGSDDDGEIAGQGHNRPGGVAVEKLQSLVKRYEKLEEEKQAIAADMRDVMQEVKGNGFDTKVFRAMVKMRQMDSAERDEYFTLLDAYARALGFSILDLEPAELPVMEETEE